MSQPIEPVPVPMQFQLARVTFEGQPDVAWVQLTVLSPTGQFVAFITADGAEALAAQLATLSARIRTGLVIAEAMPSLSKPVTSITARL